MDKDKTRKTDGIKTISQQDQITVVICLVDIFFH